MSSDDGGLELGGDRLNRDRGWQGVLWLSGHDNEAADCEPKDSLSTFTGGKNGQIPASLQVYRVGYLSGLFTSPLQSLHSVCGGAD